MSILQKQIDLHEESPIVMLPAIPEVLPAGHLSDARGFQEAVRRWGVDPSDCDFFHTRMSYLYYGGLYFRRSQDPQSKASVLPVGLLFGTGALRIIQCYYPFDTGALATPIYGATNGIHSIWRECRLDGRSDESTPRRLVQYLFGTNERYFQGRVSKACTALPEPFPSLIGFLQSNLTQYGADQRQYRIECQSLLRLSFDHLVWVGYPDTLTRWFAWIFQKHPDKPPHRNPYHTYRFARPADQAAVLQQKAYEFVKNDWQGAL